MTREVKRWWDETAEYFQDDIEMGVGVDWTGPWAPDIRLFEDVEGRDVLELGCGGGQCTIALADRGANVTGVDLSTAQLAHARDLAAEHDTDVELVQGDVTDLGMFDDASFDVAFNAWVFQWVGDLEACFAEASRVLRPGGRLVFSMPHPYYDLLDPETGEIDDSYFDTGRRVFSHDGIEADEVLYRHTLGDVHGAVRSAGFRIESMREPGSDDPEEYDEGPWGEYVPELLSSVPSVLVVDAVKPSG